MSYTKRDLRLIFTHLASLLPPGAKPLNAEQVVEVSALLEKTTGLIQSTSGVNERGRKIFEWRLPQKDAPTQNEIRGFVFRNPFIMKGIEQRIDKDLRKIVEATPEALVHGKTRRWVRVTRFTVQTKQIDDPNAIDAIGGKCAIDSLVRCGVLVDDTPAYCVREGHVAKTKKGNVHLLVEVFETAEDAVPCAPPLDAPVEQRKKRTRGPVAQHLVDAGGGEKPPAPRRKRGSLLAPVAPIADASSFPIPGPPRVLPPFGDPT